MAASVPLALDLQWMPEKTENLTTDVEDTRGRHRTTEAEQNSINQSTIHPRSFRSIDRKKLQGT